MNQFFSFNRFSLLVSKHWADNKKRYILSVLAYTGVLIAWFVIALVISDNDFMSPEFQDTTFYFSLFLTGTVYASQYFSHLGSKAKAINFLMVPASSFEKLLCSLFYTVIVFFIAITAAFYLADLLMVAVVNNFSYSESQPENVALSNVFTMNLFHFNDGSALHSVFFFFSVQSAFLLGSVSFKKFSFLKTVISIFIVWFILFWVAYLVYHLPQTEMDQEEQIPGWIQTTIRILAMYVIAPVLWILTYYRLKAKQV